MLDLGSRWSPPEEGDLIEMAGGRIRIARVRHLHQALVSGDEAAVIAALQLGGETVGAFGIASTLSYRVTIARDRFLAVSQMPFGIVEGWHDAGFAFTTVSDALAVFDITGEDLERLKERAANPALVTGSRSARVDFAGRGCLVYHYPSPDIMRVHVDRAFADYFLTWIARSL